MPSPAKRLLIPILLCALLRPATAHSSLESTASLWLRPTGIDVHIYMSRSSASLLIASSATPPAITRDNFPEFQDRLAAAARTLISLDAAPPTTPDSAAASLTDEDDICFRLHFPPTAASSSAPAATPPTLHAPYLKTMDPGHVASLYILSAANDLLTSADITADTPDFPIPTAPPTAPATIIATARTTPPPAPSDNPDPFPIWIPIAATGAAAALLFHYLRNRAAKKSKLL